MAAVPVEDPLTEFGSESAESTEASAREGELSAVEWEPLRSGSCRPADERRRTCASKPSTLCSRWAISNLVFLEDSHQVWEEGEELTSRTGRLPDDVAV